MTETNILQKTRVRIDTKIPPNCNLQLGTQFCKFLNTIFRKLVIQNNKLEYHSKEKKMPFKIMFYLTPVLLPTNGLNYESKNMNVFHLKLKLISFKDFTYLLFGERKESIKGWKF